MWTLVGQAYDRHIYIAPYMPGCLSTLPFGQTLFDCFVCLTSSGIPDELVEQISRDLDASNNDWIAVAGVDSQRLHDAIDEASVAIGRQAAVGDGLPMTAWHDDAVTSAEMAELALSCSGNGDHVAVIVVGSDVAQTEIKAAIELRLSHFDD